MRKFGVYKYNGVEEKENFRFCLTCKECKLLHVLEDVDQDYSCRCGNKLVEHTTNSWNIGIFPSDQKGLELEH